MDGGSEGQRERRHRRRPWGWGLFLLAVLGLRLTALGSDPPTAGAGAPPPAASDVVDGDPVAADRLAWVVAAADALTAEPATRVCLDAGVACLADDILAVDTTAARAASLAAALSAATDPAGEGYLGAPPAAVGERAQLTRQVATAAADAMGQWVATGCGGFEDGVPVTAPPEGCAARTADAVAALDALVGALAEWGS